MTDIQGAQCWPEMPLSELFLVDGLSLSVCENVVTRRGMQRFGLLQIFSDRLQKLDCPFTFGCFWRSLFPVDAGGRDRNFPGPGIVVSPLPRRGLRRSSARPKLSEEKNKALGPSTLLVVKVLAFEVVQDSVPLLLGKWVRLRPHSPRPPFFGKFIEGIFSDHFLGHSITEESPKRGIHHIFGGLYCEMLFLG